MPYRCCVPECSGNYGYRDAPKVTVFSFPEHENLRKEWLHGTNFVRWNISKVYASYIFRSKASSLAWKNGPRIF
nr:unnamed protein product [Callosobruchus chinensis]